MHGTIVNTTGELVPDQEGHFEFQTVDQVDAFRVPEVGIRWVAASKDGSWKKYGSNKYIELRSDGVFNDRIFEQKFPRKGIYEIHAFVNHNFYLPAHFVIPIEVRTETERLKTADERSGFGRVNRVEPKSFRDVIDEERRRRRHLHGAVRRRDDAAAHVAGPSLGVRAGAAHDRRHRPRRDGRRGRRHGDRAGPP